jgi:hypothetical protein
MSNKIRPKSRFQEELSKTFKQAREEKYSPEKKKELRLSYLENVFEALGNKTNRYLFYCPDMPMASTLVKAIYQFVYLLNQSGYENAIVLHEIKPFKATKWLDTEWAKEVPIQYIVNKPKKGITDHEPTYRFLPTDTIIIPEGFWSVMINFAEDKQIQKVVLAAGYGGIITAQEGANWGHLGFNNVICFSEKLKEDYKKVWPHLSYYVTPYIIDPEELDEAPIEEKYPAIAISARNREDAGAIINVFRSRYPFLAMFQFKVLKKLSTSEYVDVLRYCSVLVFIDEKSGHPAPPLEAIGMNIPVLSVYGRGQEHLREQEGVIWVDRNDPYDITEVLANMCIDWLENISSEIKNKDILENYSPKKVRENIVEIFNNLQENRIKFFSALKTAVESDAAAAEAVPTEIELQETSLKLHSNEENKIN